MRATALSTAFAATICVQALVLTGRGERICAVPAVPLRARSLLVTNNGRTQAARQRRGDRICVNRGQHGRVFTSGLDNRQSASVLAPNGFESGQARLAADRREQSELPAIKPGAISCRRDEGTRGHSDNACGQRARRAGQRRFVPLHRCARGSQPCAQVAWQAGNAPADDGEPGPQRPSQGTHRRIEEADEGDFVSRFRKPPRDLEGHEPTEGIAAQVIGAVRPGCRPRSSACV